MDGYFDRELEQILAARLWQEARRNKQMLKLLETRNDLRGVHALADGVIERVLWCA